MDVFNAFIIVAVFAALVWLFMWTWQLAGWLEDVSELAVRHHCRVEVLECSARKRCKARSCGTKTPRGGPSRFADEETGDIVGLTVQDETLVDWDVEGTN